MNEETSKELRTRITAEGKLVMSLETVPMPKPKDDEVLIRVEASPINPSDLGLLIGPADVATLQVGGTDEFPVVTMNVPENMMKMVSARVDLSLPAGNEGAGIVVAAGANAESLIGKTVGVAGGGMYSQYRCVAASNCLVMHEGTTPAEGASCFVNPLTALGMVETMKLENHTGLVHTAAASNLGQMLVKICLNDDVPLVNIVRRSEHVELLKSLGARYVCNSSESDFMEELIQALVETGATLGFDATGGGKLTGQILTAMEVAANKTAGGFSRYGSTIHKQVYIYGGLDRNPTVLNRAFGMAWGIGGWLLTPFIQRVGGEKFEELRQRVADEIKTTFASRYTKEVSLAEALQAESINVYAKQATGEKYLINPSR
ncbi:MAG: zinc-binding dehydrogenase [Pseudomonadales bacterium]|jgi:NADPH2:quinone reductase|nr:NADH oxidase [Gammaproteobacteria bacterium]MDP6027635.1 zinc-binding dehydrogenase [Pseudomonadales bacterium]MDP7576983.1 zinc-binding dehydrogenase [Pseudomonadales bacterium]HJP52541.1 zinc-binding dehydrogenase [Pseudomonadales bacterium]